MKIPKDITKETATEEQLQYMYETTYPLIDCAINPMDEFLNDLEMSADWYQFIRSLQASTCDNEFDIDDPYYGYDNYGYPISYSKEEYHYALKDSAEDIIESWKEYDDVDA